LAGLVPAICVFEIGCVRTPKQQSTDLVIVRASGRSSNHSRLK